MGMSAIFVYSCKNESGDLGLGVIDDEVLLNSSVIDTFSLDTRMILSTDEIVSSGASELLVGAYVDDYLGNVQASSYFQIRLDNASFNFGDGATCDSVVLQLDYDDYYYGDTTQAQTLEVYSLAQEMNKDSSYLITDEIPLDQFLGEKTLTATPKNEDALLRITLPVNFGQSIIDNGNNTNADFTSIIYGLCVRPKNDNEGAVIGFSPFNTDSRVVVYYHNNTTDNKQYTLNYGSNAKRFNKISSDKSSTLISGLVNEGDQVSSSATNNQCYAQASTGIRILFSIPALESFRDSIGNIAINRAELYMNISPGTNGGEHEEPAESIIIYEYDDATQIGRNDNGTLDLVVGDYRFQNGFPQEIVEHSFSDSKQYYRVLLTDWINDYFLGKRDNTNIVLSASGNGYTVDRFIVEDSESAVSEKEMKLVIYYSKKN